MPEHLSMLVRDIDPLVERVIERCMASDPKDRPATALQVAAALRRRPLQAALAAGETPSPEMVAASSTQGALRPRWPQPLRRCARALRLPVSVAAGMLHRRVPLERVAIGLRERAGEVARKLGYAEASDRPSATRRWRVPRTHQGDRQVATRWNRLASGQRPAMLFWYRKARAISCPTNARAVTPADRRARSPAWPSSRRHAGRLLLEGVPPHLNEPQRRAARGLRWSLLFNEAGLDITKFTPAEPKWLPPQPYDSLAAWEGAYPDQSDMTMQVVVGAFRGRAVYFPSSTVEPATRQVAARQNTQTKLLNAVLIVFLLLILSSAVLLAWRNLQLGRGDRKGAFRIAAVAFVLHLVAWLFSAHHVPDLGEFSLFIENLAWSLMISGMMWIVYIALEPFVRRRWPRRIISWNRLLAGDFRDPLVGRDILLGAVFCFGFCSSATSSSTCRASWASRPRRPPSTASPSTPFRARSS